MRRTLVSGCGAAVAVVIAAAGLVSAGEGEKAGGAENAGAGEADGVVDVVLPGSIETTEGRRYRDCELLKRDPDGVTFAHSGGIAKVSFTALPEALREAFGFDEEKAAAFVKKHTERPKPARRAVSRVERAVAAGAAPYGTVVVNGGGAYWPWAGPYYGTFHDGHGRRGERRFAGYRRYPNVSFQVSPGSRAGSPVAPTLVSPTFFQNQLEAVQRRAGFPPPRVPVVRPRLNTPNRPGPVIRGAGPSRPLSGPSRPLGD